MKNEKSSALHVRVCVDCIEKKNGKKKKEKKMKALHALKSLELIVPEPREKTPS